MEDERIEMKNEELDDDFVLDKRALLELGVGLAVIATLAYGSYALGFKVGKHAKAKEIDRVLDAALEHCKKDELGVLLHMSTKKNKNFGVYIWK